VKWTIPILLLLSFVAISCAVSKTEKFNLAEIEKLQAENDSLKNILTQNRATLKKQIITFLTFQDNNAENAMNFYVKLFDNSKIIKVQRWGKEGPVEEGKIMHATFDLNGNLFMCSDSPPIHNWDFSPAVSNYIECENESELERLFSKLSEKGNVTMPLNNYGFSQKFGWVIDQFGVSWQLNLQ
jgi:predicted 3-demethylubiquinone-9 3-methyltransferase (glyoxalase superfamily)